jgi:hypothetical protein
MMAIASHPGYDLRGAVVGDATVVEPVSRGEGRGVVWEVVCPCGAVQHRTTGQITFARDMDRRILCPRCVKELRMAQGLTRQDRRVEFFYSAIRRINPAILESPGKLRSILATLLQKYGLYDLGYDDREEEELREEIHRALGAPADVILEVPEVLPIGEGTTVDALDWSNFYPMLAPDGHGLHCDDCGEDRERGWGCIRCMKFSCRQCLPERHMCQTAMSWGWAVDGVTLEVVGKEIGVTRERARQIEARAIGRFAKVWRAVEERADAVAAAARAKVLRQLPDVAGQEEKWAAHEALRLKKIEEERERLVKWQKTFDIASVDQIRVALRWHVERKIMLERVKGVVSRLPWDLRYCPAFTDLFVMGDSVTACDSLEGLVSCLRCRKIVLYGSTESAAHGMDIG